VAADEAGAAEDEDVAVLHSCSYVREIAGGTSCGF
jgi:hypothetical protein